MIIYASIAVAKDWYVEQDGSGDSTTLSGLDGALTHDDTIYVGPGTYQENGLDYTLLGGVNVIGVGAEETIFDGSEATLALPFIQVNGGEISGITFRGLSRGGAAALAFRQDAWAGEVVIHDCKFENLDRAIDLGPGSNDIVITNSTFTDNAKILDFDTTVDYIDIENNLFLGNVTVSSLAGYDQGPQGLAWTIAHNTFVMNGSGVALTFSRSVDTSSLPTIFVVNNVFSGGSSAILIDVEASGASFVGLVDGNVFASDVVEPEVYLGVPDVVHGNTTMDPGFVLLSDDGDWTDDDLHLRWSSASIDYGLSGYAVQPRDRDGTGRPQDGNLDGIKLPDVGAYEMNPDVDEDGYPAVAAGGTDCDDASVTAHPGAPEICDDDIDQDCDGVDAACSDTGDSDGGDETGDTEGGEDDGVMDSSDGSEVNEAADSAKRASPGCGCANAGGVASVSAMMGALSVVLARRRFTLPFLAR